LHIGSPAATGTTGSRSTSGTSGSGTASSLWSLSNLFGTHDSGGYVPKGIFSNAGATEFMLDARSTKAMERIVGGQLNQSNIMRAAQSGGQVVWNDNRRFDGTYTEDIRRENRKDTMRVLSEVLQ
jgi:hypothetical protein